MADMWKTDEQGTLLESAAEALRSLRERAERMIREAEARGQDARSCRIRLRDEEGKVHFEGTLAEAAKLRVMGLLVSALVATDFLLPTLGDAASFFETMS